MNATEFDSMFERLTFALVDGGIAQRVDDSRDRATTLRESLIQEAAACWETLRPTAERDDDEIEGNMLFHAALLAVATSPRLITLFLVLIGAESFPPDSAGGTGRYFFPAPDIDNACRAALAESLAARFTLEGV
jgi:hypothetical protein